jgi:glycosyltransferase involved in cell wall biosynthesis
MGGRFTVYLRAALFLLRHGREYDSVLDVTNGIPFFAPLWTRTPATLLVHHVHGHQWFTEFSRPLAAFGWLLERFIVPVVYRSAPVIAVSPTTRDALVKTGFRADRVEIVYNGVDQTKLLEVGRRKPAGESVTEPAEVPRIVYVGRIKRHKRLELLVRAFASLRAEFPNLRLDIGGDGDARPKIAELVRSLELGDSVVLHGFLDETAKVKLLADATVFATPSMQEGWGLSVIEANALGCPAVAYDVAGLRNAIVHGETGLLAADDAAFAAGIAVLLRDSSLRARLSAGASAWAREFDWDTCARSTLRILDSEFEAGPTFEFEQVGLPAPASLEAS